MTERTLTDEVLVLSCTPKAWTRARETATEKILLEMAYRIERLELALSQFAAPAEQVKESDK
jgi:hypothetical protein